VTRWAARLLLAVMCWPLLAPAAMALAVPGAHACCRRAQGHCEQHQSGFENGARVCCQYARTVALSRASLAPRSCSAPLPVALPLASSPADAALLFLPGEREVERGPPSLLAS
jgi:hypothetical protein